MDRDLPDRVLAALGLATPRCPITRRTAPRRAALALGLLATLALLLLPEGDDTAARLAQVPLFSAPAPALRPMPQPVPPHTAAPAAELGFSPAARRLERTR